MGRSTPRDRALRAIRRSLPASAQSHIEDCLGALADAVAQEIHDAEQEEIIRSRGILERCEAAEQKCADLLLANCALADELAVRDEADRIEEEEDGQ